MAPNTLGSACAMLLAKVEKKAGNSFYSIVHVVCFTLKPWV